MAAIKTVYLEPKVLVEIKVDFGRDATVTFFQQNSYGNWMQCTVPPTLSIKGLKRLRNCITRVVKKLKD